MNFSMLSVNDVREDEWRMLHIKFWKCRGRRVKGRGQKTTPSPEHGTLKPAYLQSRRQGTDWTVRRQPAWHFRVASPSNLLACGSIVIKRLHINAFHQIARPIYQHAISKCHSVGRRASKFPCINKSAMTPVG